MGAPKIEPKKTEKPEGGESQQSGDILKVSAGATILKEGEPGGDLYFIQSGQVDVFRNKDGHDVILARLKQGEVIGTMTCLTGEPRLASARALTDCELKHVKAKNVQAMVNQIPHWMRSVLKDYGSRIRRMNEVFSEAVSAISDLAVHVPTPLVLASRFANGLHAIGDMQGGQAPTAGKKGATEQNINFTDAHKVICRTLACSENEMTPILSAFREFGLLRVEGAEKGATLSMSSIRDVGYFEDFMHLARKEKGKLMKLNVISSEQKALLTIAQVAKTLSSDATKEMRIPMSQLSEAFDKVSEKKLDSALIEKGQAAGFLAVEKQGDVMEVVFVPHDLHLRVSHYGVFRKLELLDGRSATVKDPTKLALHLE